MATYNIYHHPLIGYRAVRKGFSWPAFFGTGFWALSHKRYVLGAVAAHLHLFMLMMLLVLAIAAVKAAAPIEDVLLSIAYMVCPLLLMSVLFGALGQRAAITSYNRRGFLWVADAEARSARSAIEAVVKTWGKPGEERGC